MARPPLSDWESVFDFSEDPTPGNPEVLERLASEYRSVAHDASSAHSVVSRLESNDLGEGKSMDKLREKLSDLPGQVEKLSSSYEAAADAVAAFADKLRDNQEQADRALEKGREAKDRLTSATEVAAGATAQVKSLGDAEPPPPDDAEARSSARRAMADAQQAESEANRSVASAQAELDAARMLAEDAAELCSSDASVAKQKLEEAEDEAVEGKSFWDKLLDILGMVFGMIGAILGVISMFITGPVGLLLAVGSFIGGAISFGITAYKGSQTGNWDIAGLILGGIGLAFGGFSIFQAAKGLSGVAAGAGKAGGAGKIGGADWVKGKFTGGWKEMRTPDARAMLDNLNRPALPKPDLGGGAGAWADDVLAAGLKTPKPTPPAPGPASFSGGPALGGNVAPRVSSIQASLDASSFGFTAAGFIYTPISFESLSQATYQQEGKFPKVIA